MIKRISCSFFIILSLVFGNEVVGSSNSNECGPLCLQKIYFYLNRRTVDIETIKDTSDYRINVGTSIYGLYASALYLHLPVVPCKLKYKDLIKLKNPSIILIDNHYYIFHKGNEKIATLEDPPGPVFQVKTDDLLMKWSGETLVFSRDLSSQVNGINKDSSPKIQLNYDSINIERVNPNDIFEISLNVMNIGEKTLVVRLRPSCNCGSLEKSLCEIPPGKFEIITGRFNTTGYIGLFKSAILLSTNDPANRLLSVNVTANIDDNIPIFPEKVYLNNIVRKSHVDTLIIIKNVGDIIFDKINNSIFSCTPSFIDKNEDIQQINLSLDFQNYIGDFRDELTFSIDKTKYKIEIIGNLINDISVEPQLIFISPVKVDSSITKRITLNTTNNIDNISSNFKTISTNVIKTDNNTIVDIKFDFYKTGIVDENILFKIGEDIVELPFYARIVE